MRFFKYLTSLIDKPEPVLRFVNQTHFTRRRDGASLGTEESTYLLRENAFGFRDVKIFQGTMSENKGVAKEFEVGFFMWKTSKQTPCDLPWADFFKGCTMQVLHRQRYGIKQSVPMEKTTEVEPEEQSAYKF